MGVAPAIRTAKLAPAAQFMPPADALVVFILNVGDGDAIVLQFPDDGTGHAYAAVDSNDGDKTVDLLRNGLRAGELRFVCATHPHIDHIRGLEEILGAYSGNVGEFWDSGFRFTSKTYNGIIKEVERQTIQFIRPTSGLETFIKGVRVTVLSPSIMLRNRYDTYGVDPNNASIVLRLEYPQRPPKSDYPADADGGDAAAEPPTRSIILGGDAQTDAWSRVLEEFPHLDKDDSNWARQIRACQGRQPLLCDVFKVAHHCSKHGINLELIERMGDRSGAGPSQGPACLVSSCADEAKSKHGFPHAVAQEILREVREPLATSGGTRKRDDELGIHYTAQDIEGTSQPQPAGSVAVVLHSNGDRPTLYRLCDGVPDPVDLTVARQVL